MHDLIFAERNWHDYAAHAPGRPLGAIQVHPQLRPDKPLTPPADAVRSPTFQAMRRLRDRAKLTGQQRACFLQPRPAEELYDVEADPDELTQPGRRPKKCGRAEAMRRALAEWQRETGDLIPAELTPRRIRPRDRRPTAGPRASQTREEEVESNHSHMFIPSQPPRNPARCRPRSMGGQRRITSQSTPVR